MFLTFSVNLMAQTDKTVTVNVKNVEVRKVLDLLQQQTNYHFVYEEEAVSKNTRVSLQYRNETFMKVLTDLCEQTFLQFEIKRTVVLLYPRKEVKPAKDISLTLTGTVSDEIGEGLPGVNVFCKESGRGTITDVEGTFSLKVNIGDVLIFRFIGMEEEVFKVIPGKNRVNILLKTSTETLQDVVVTGYQTLSKERVTGSFATVSSKEMEGKLQTSIMERLEGAMAGVTSYNGVQIRGVSTINGTRSPLYVVNGVPYEGSLDAINPSEITNVTVLKDAAAASIYGARSANGVIVITTKSGTKGPTRVNYNGSINLTPFYDTDYQNLMSSSEFVDFQQTLFNLNSGTRPAGYYLNEVRQLLFDHKDGKISEQELNRQLDVYRSRDRKDQAMEAFVRTPAVTHQHNLALSGGGDKYTYSLSLNYMQNLPYDKNVSNDRMGFNLKNSYDFTKWLHADVGIMGSMYNADYNNGYSGVGAVTGSGKASYLLYWDEEGNELPWYMQKSQEEIDRLNSLGLLDESYYPLQEVAKRYFQQKDAYLNFNTNLKFKISNDLSFNLIFQKDYSYTYSKQFDSKDSYEVKNMVNNATQIVDGEIIQNIPTGGQLIENRGDKNSYTLRGQLNYNNSFAEKHRITLIAGAERRAVKRTATGIYKVGYDDNSLSYKVIDENMLGKTIQGTESLSGSFTYASKEAGLSYVEDRYVSFYGNTSYVFDERASLTASIRIDQSNLFGTDPKYQYRPLWSAGAHYLLLKDQFGWVDRLALRTTYGINGNIPKESGPYLTVKDGGVNSWTNEYSSTILYPPNSGLRWEKTAVWNIGIDFNLFKNRLNGSIEFYNKNTSDLLYNRTMDPTLGWGKLMVNYGDMYNRGVELSIHSKNLSVKNFSWESSFNFSYNKNKLTKLQEANTDAIYYINSAQLRVGKAMNSLYSVRWAGLDETGAPQAYKKDGTIVKSFANLTVNDLVYSGVSTPPYAASLSNSLRYKDFSLSFLLTYYGGHVMRGVFGQYLINTGYSSNQDKLTGNFWQKPGDEADPSKSPALKMSASANVQNLWKAADKHIQPGDFIKLNEISLTYNVPSTLLKKTFIKNLRCTFQVRDVWKWVANDMGLDPEAWSGGTTLSPSRGTKAPATYSVGLSCDF